MIEPDKKLAESERLVPTRPTYQENQRLGVERPHAFDIPAKTQNL